MAAAEDAVGDLAARFGLQPVAELPADPGLDDLLGYALVHSDGLAAARAAEAAATARIDASGSLPRPRFTWSEAIEPVETRVGPQERILSLSQEIPWFGTLGLQRDVVADRAAGARARTEAAALAVLREVRTAYHELAFLDRSLATATGHLDLLVQLEAVARSRYETGAGSYADVVKAQVEMAQLEDRVRGLRDLRRPLEARLAAALGGSYGATIAPRATGDGPADLDPDLLGERMIAANPGLTGLAREAESELKAGSLAGKRRYPGLSLGFNWIQIGEARTTGTADSGKDAAFATLGISLPLWQGSYGAEEEVAASRYRAAEHRRSDLVRDLEARLARALYEYRDAGRRIALYRDTLVPKAGQSLAAARAAYETGAAAFLELVDAERVLLEFELARWRAEADRRISLAVLEELVAGPVGPRGDAREVGHAD
jgi:outer membrane protein TolC